MLTNADVKYWAPNPAMLDKLEGEIFKGARVLEIGPGRVPFSRATHFVDWRAGDNIVSCDLSRDRLPFADKEFDFVYCRHVLEDLYNPFLACDEMSRVAKAGYIETPSPLAEICRGIDGTSPPWRGYHHHRYFVWVEDDDLFFAPKYPIVEHLSFGDEMLISNALRDNEFLWNSYLSWEGRINWRLLQHDVDYTIGNGYRDVILKAVKIGMANALESAPVELSYSMAS
jgi:hypothetical protein